MKKLFSRLFVSILSVSLFVLLFIMFFLAVFYFKASKQWSNNSFNEFSQRLAVCLAQNSDDFNLKNIVGTSLDCALEDNRISGLIFRNEEGKVIYSFGKTQFGGPLSQREEHLDIDSSHKKLESGTIDDESYKSVVTISPINLIQTKMLNNLLYVDLIQITNSDNIFEKRKIEVPEQVDAKSITGSIIITKDNQFLYAVDVLVFTPSTYKYSKDLFSVGSIWLISIILIALQFSLVLSYYFSRQLENYAKGLRKALFKLSKGEENVDLPQYNVEEYQEINLAIKKLDKDLAQNRKNRKAWLRNITHDLNTPVTSMQILLDGLEDNIFPLDHTTIALLKKEHTDLSKRINRVILYSSLQSPDKEIYISKCSVDDIINYIKKSDIYTEEIQFVKFENYLDADYSTIILAINSLIENALEYGVGEIIVEFSKNEVQVINKGKLKKDVSIFEPWERGDKSRSEGGNGLGLPIVYEVMRLHNGSITLNEVDGKVIAQIKWSTDIKLISQ